FAQFALAEAQSTATHTAAITTAHLTRTTSTTNATLTGIDADEVANNVLATTILANITQTYFRPLIRQ
ncbi:MAG: hypothetical protein KDA62_06105, partial [Planctomycetales bacterium]|nr:hypothetical protein [Planctomycetales bacterium]